MTHICGHVSVAMRDGTKLAGFLFRPTAGTAPTLVVRTPYGLDLPIGGNSGTYPHFLRLLEAGYAILWVECRGTFRSEGEFRPKVDEIADGYDTLDWIVHQSWSNGEVGAYGMSYFGMTQWGAAVSGHPALKAIVPMMTGMDFYKGAWFSPGNAMSAATTSTWFISAGLNELMLAESSEGNRALISDITAGLLSGTDLVDFTPLADHPLLAPNTAAASAFHELLDHPSYDTFWQSQDFAQGIEQVTMPALIIAGWYDIFLSESIRDFQLVRTHGGSVEAREASRLIVGPWDHGDLMDARYPVRDFGLAGTGGAAKMTDEHLRHFARHLPTDTNRVEPDAPKPPRVKLFVMGIDEWRDEDEWPLPDTQYITYYLAGSTLSPTSHGESMEHSYAYDPKDAVRTTSSNRPLAVWQPNDQREKGSRADILTFQTPPIEKALEVIGAVRAHLWVGSDARDTDFTAMLIDVFPDGKAVNLCEGIVRMRYRSGAPTPAYLTPYEIYPVEIDLTATADVFLPGHRVRLDISSSNFPRYDRNTNTGGSIHRERLRDSVVATNTVFSGPSYPSGVTLPVVVRMDDSRK